MLHTYLIPKYSFLVYGELLKLFAVIYEKLKVTDILFYGPEKTQCLQWSPVIYILAAAAAVLRHHKWPALAHLLLKGNMSPLGRGPGVLNDGGSERVNLLQLGCI